MGRRRGEERVRVVQGWFKGIFLSVLLLGCMVFIDVYGRLLEGNESKNGREKMLRDSSMGLKMCMGMGNGGKRESM